MQEMHETPLPSLLPSPLPPRTPRPNTICQIESIRKPSILKERNNSAPNNLQTKSEVHNTGRLSVEGFQTHSVKASHNSCILITSDARTIFSTILFSIFRFSVIIKADAGPTLGPKISV